MESLIFQCEVCSISLTGMTNYTKHVNSLEHASVIQLNKSGNITDEDKIGEKIQPGPILNSTNHKLLDCASGVGFQCEPCQMLFSGPVPYKQHLESARHQKNTGMLLGSSQSCNSNVLKCEACDKTFTGSVPFNQHIVSNVHKKKVLQKGILKNANIDASSFGGNIIDNDNNVNSASVMQSASPQRGTLEVLRCEICDKNFSGPRPYEDHQNSNGHQKKVLKKELLIEEEERKLFFTSGSTLKDNNHTLSSNFKGNEIHQQSEIPESRKEIRPNPISNHLLELEQKFIKKEGSACSITTVDNITDVTITHDLESHISVIPSIMGNTFVCSICDKFFNGKIPLNVHLKSNAHKKKIYEKEVIKKMNNNDVKYLADSSTETQEKVALSELISKEWYCRVCKKQCSGPIPYSQHTKSEAHCKNIQLIEMKAKHEISTTMSVSCLTEEINREENESSIIGGDCIGLSGVLEVKRNHSDLIFDDILTDLNFISPENLNITIFRPKETVRFDAVSKS